MKTTTAALVVALLIPARAAANDRVDRVLDEIDDLWRGRSSKATVQMTVKTEHYTRNMKMKAWSLGEELSLIRIESPLKERGTATLKSGNDVYTYLPKTDRTIRLTSGMMMGSWMGSHFTNDDLVKESRLLEDYEAELIEEEKRGEKTHWTVKLVPKPDAPVVWGKIILKAELDRRIPLEQIYYDEDGDVARTMTFSKVKAIDGRPRPTVMKVVPADEPDELTKLVYERIEFDVDLDESFFSINRLRRRR